MILMKKIWYKVRKKINDWIQNRIDNWDFEMQDASPDTKHWHWVMSKKHFYKWLYRYFNNWDGCGEDW